MIGYSNDQLAAAKKYKCATKAIDANRRFEDKITEHDVLMLLERFGFRCLYCGDLLKENSWQLDHFYSRYLGGKNVASNLAPACKWCNQMKSSLDGFAFANWCGKVYNNNRLKELFGSIYPKN